jgi:hypothetical protein
MTDNGHRTYLGREAIFAADDRPTEAIQVPEWGHHWLRIGTWTLATSQRIARASQTESARDRLLALVVALSVVDDAGQRCFSDDDVAALAERKSFKALHRVAQAAMKWNGLDADAVDALGKASETPANVASPSGSPAPSA